MNEFENVRFLKNLIKKFGSVTLTLSCLFKKKVFFIGSCSFDILAMGEGKTKVLPFSYFRRYCQANFSFIIDSRANISSLNRAASVKSWSLAARNILFLASSMAFES